MLKRGRRLFANFCSGEPDGRLFVRCVCHGIAEKGVMVGPMLRESWFLQLVFGGEALFDGKSVKAGQAFLMRPGLAHELSVISDDAFEQYWLEVTGSEAGRLFASVFEDADVISYPFPDLLAPVLREAVYGRFDDGFAFSGLLLTLLSRLSSDDEKSADRSGGYVLNAMEYLRQNCQNGVTASDAALAVGLSEKYLCRLFREKAGVTPTEFLQAYRLSQAKALLTGTDLPIRQIAEAVGFEDQTYFSRFFRSRVGKSPSAYRLSGRE